MKKILHCLLLLAFLGSSCLRAGQVPLQDRMTDAVKYNDEAAFRQALRQGAYPAAADCSGRHVSDYSTDKKWQNIIDEEVPPRGATLWRNGSTIGDNDDCIRAGLASRTAQQNGDAPASALLHMLKKDTLATDSEAKYKELIGLIASKDLDAIHDMYLAGEVFMVEGGTEVFFVESGSSWLSTACKVRRKGERRTFWLSFDALEQPRKR